jgi:DNA-binding LytR/AlgR family response regulator
VKVLVVDDEPLARRRLLRMLGRIPGVEVVGEAADGEAALERIRALAPDVVLLDIRMPGLDGMTLAARTPDLPPIVFTTAYDEYAVRAFEANAVDYLLKPVEASRLEAALAKAERVRAERTRAAHDPERLAGILRQILERGEAQPGLRLTARAGNVVRVVDPKDVTRIRAAGHYAVFKHEGRELVLDESLAALEEKLVPLGFLRVHRAELVNLHHVRGVRLEEGGAVALLSDGEAAPVSRRSLPDLKQRLGIADPTPPRES